MTTNFEETLISVGARRWLNTVGPTRSKMVNILSGPPADPNCGKSISGSKTDAARARAKSEYEFALGTTGTPGKARSGNS